MQDFLNHPAVQGAVAPLLVALVVSLVLMRTRFAWLALIAGYATMIALSTGFSLSPLTAGRKVMLVGLASPVAGLIADLLPRFRKCAAIALAVIAAALSPWVFLSVLRQRETWAGASIGAGIALFVLLLVIATLRLRDDGLRTGAAGFGLGLATGVAGVISASIGYLLGGAALAASSGALLLVQVIRNAPIAAGFTGAYPVAVLAATFAAATMLLAQLPWYALPLLLLVPLAASMPVPERAPLIARAAILCGYTLVASLIPIAAAWFAARGSAS